MCLSVKGTKNALRAADAKWRLFLSVAICTLPERKCRNALAKRDKRKCQAALMGQGFGSCNQFAPSRHTWSSAALQHDSNCELFCVFKIFVLVMSLAWHRTCVYSTIQTQPNGVSHSLEHPLQVVQTVSHRN